MKPFFTNVHPFIVLTKKRILQFFLTVSVLLLFNLHSIAQSQLGTYQFTGLLLGTCPNNNNTVNSQPANATFSSFTNVGATCIASTTDFNNLGWNTGAAINLSQYNQFTITPSAGYELTLTSLSFTEYTDKAATSWILRSSLDNYATNIATGTITITAQTPVINLPTATFTNIGAVTFRFYVTGAQNGNASWGNDDVTVNGSVIKLPSNPPNPTSNSPQCLNPGVTLTESGSPPTGETWYWQTTPTGTNTTNSASTYTVGASGIYYIRSQDNTTLAWSAGSGSLAVTITPDVSTPVFSLGATSTRCQAANSITYTATAPNNSGISYSLDATSIAAGNSIDGTTGAVTYDAAWVGTSIITATASGCNGPKSATHTVTTNAPITTPVFDLGSTSVRCQGAGTVTYNATATNTTGITYTLDATSRGAGNTIVAATGAVTYVAGWSGTSTITATAAGCPANLSATHTVTITSTVGTPVFVMGASSSRCEGAGTVTYTATATTNTGITYSLDATSLAGGNSIDSTTGTVTFDIAWVGTSTITSTATGCNGPKSSTHTVTTKGYVTTPVFTLGSSSVRCQGTTSQTVTYTATATNTTGITYSLDATTAGFAGNSINAATGAVTYSLNWTGTSVITASAAGCSGPQTATHTVTTTPTVTVPVFAAGGSSTRCQGAGTVNYGATSSNTTGITYSINAASTTAGNTIDVNTGDVTYVATYSGTTTVTASAAGCNGPKTATHTVTVTATVGTPVFSLGATSTRCQAAGTVTYTATATTNTGITYSLDATSLGAGNSINSANGAVTYVNTWAGTSVITATATGCNGPSTASHTVTVTPVVTGLAFDMGSTSSRCQGAGTVTYNATATNTTGITYTLDATSRGAGNTIVAATGAVTYAAGWSGTSTITATAAGCSPQTATHTVTVVPTVGTPVFVMGASSSRCEGAGTVTYTATATTNTGITYSLDATSLAGGNSIDSTTGTVTFDIAWVGTSTITSTATGCNGPKSSTHTVTTKGYVTTPVFTLGASSVRCQGTTSQTVTYTATATNTTGITYSLDATTAGFAGNSINAATGAVTYSLNWTGTSVITASAAGCSGPQTATHTVTTTPTVTVPVFAAGGSSTRCQGAGTVNYGATSSNTTGITYSINAASTTAGNTIDVNTGDVTYVATYSGTTTVTASAAGCNGPKTATHTVTVTATVGTPVFSLGATSTRCQAAGTVTYTATATTNTGITYSLDATSVGAGNSINSANGAVTYVNTWSGTSVITATATGCNGPSTASHTVTVTPIVTGLAFDMGSTSSRCQGAGTVTYNATATNTTGITYTLDATSRGAGNTIVAATGAVTYAAGWSGTSTITATAAGCSPQTATHTVTVIPTVGTPVFALGASSSRCEGAGTVTYTATATTNTGITYSLDAASIAGGNTIDATTGTVTYVATWSGTSTITATATGCNGPKSSSHTVTTKGYVTTPVFTLGSSSVRCQGTTSQTVTYTATASNTTGITYSLDATTAGFAGNSINAASGVVTYSSNWTGTTVITASAAGCSGPQTATHTVTTTPYVTVPVFTAGGSSTRCQGAGTVGYGATSSNTTGITYTLDGSSTAGGNSINNATGDVTWAGNWFGASTITASAAGCSGPKTATHTVTTTASVGTPVFNMGASSSRSQSAATITYTATATTTTGITYSLDAASLAGGNTINSATGVVNYDSTWSGSSVITASAAGCNGPASSTHISETNPTTVTTPLYLNGPGTSLNRIDPVATNKISTIYSSTVTSGSNFTFTQIPILCSPLTIKAKTIQVILYVSSVNSLSTTPNLAAKLRYNLSNIITLVNPVYNSGAKTITWTGTLGTDITVPAGEAISLDVSCADNNADFRISYGSKTAPSKINLPVSNYVNITSLKIFDGAYPGGAQINSSVPGVKNYIRAVATSPFGASDVTGLDVTITPDGSTYAAVPVDSTSCDKIYEYVWNTPALNGKYSISASAKQGYENAVFYFDVISSTVCTTCPPVAYNDSAKGAGGAPILIDVLANDYDPNDNLNVASLSLINPPKNGDAILSGGKFVYVPNGTFAGRDTFRYQICDSTLPSPLCAMADVYVNVDPTIVDPCSDATHAQVYYLPFAETEARTALLASQNQSLVINNIRDIISLKMPYPGMTIVWDHWEDGYETDISNPVQPTTQVWGDGNPYNGIAPGYPDDIIPAGGAIVLDNTMPANPRLPANIFYDGKDKIYSSGQISVVQVVGEPSVIGLQCMKTNVSSTQDFGTSFTIPVGQNFPSQDFAYNALFLRASHDSTIVSIDKDNNGTYETNDTLMEGKTLIVPGVYTGASVVSTGPIGIDLHFGGIDGYSSREVPIYPASWYSNIYYSPVPTTGSGTAIKDTNAVYLYNNLNRSITINWTSGVPSSGSILLPAKTVKRFAMPLSATAAYKFVNPTGESFTAIQVCDSYTPGGGGNRGSEFDWAFNLISESRLTSFATLAWAPGSTDGTRNDNPIWVTPTNNTTVYVKYNGDLTNGGSVSPCGLHYDISYPLNTLNHKRIKDPTDNNQGGMAIYTCDGTKIAAVYGEDPSTAAVGNPSWDVGATMRPFCSLKLIFANDDYAFTVTDNPVTIPILKNDTGFAAIINPSSVITAGLLQPKHGTTQINQNGTILYTPNVGFQGKDTFEYNVCSTPSPIVCDNATVYVTVNSCPPPKARNILYGKVFMDNNKNGINNIGEPGYAGSTVYLYVDGNCNGIIDANELSDSMQVDSSGTYQFITYPEKTVSDDFDGPGGTSTCSSGSDDNSQWAGNWVDAGDPSVGFCVSPTQTVANTDAEIVKDGTFGYALRLKDKSVSATRGINLSGATYAFLSFSYRRTSTTQTAAHDLLVQASSNGSTFATIYTIKGDGNKDANYVNVYNQDITAYASANTVIRFLTNASMLDADSVYIDNVSVKYLKYPQCYITKVSTTSMPMTYSLTTPAKQVTTFAGSGSCATPSDFGVSNSAFFVLPVDLINLKGKAIKEANLLTWSTSSEINSSRFEVETKTDFTDFVKIGTVAAKGNSSVESSYNFVHANPPQGISYYRLRVVDKDERFKYSNIIALKSGGVSVNVDRIYPNPFKDEIDAAIALESAQKLYINIYDVSGSLVKSLTKDGVKGLNLISINNLGFIASGVYFIEIKDSNGSVKAKLFKL